MCATRDPRMLFSVTSQSFHLALDVVVEDEQLRGEVCDGLGQPTTFSGWLGLIAALDRLLETTDPARDRGGDRNAASHS